MATSSSDDEDDDDDEDDVEGDEENKIVLPTAGKGVKKELKTTTKRVTGKNATNAALTRALNEM
jgi:hypothetical protein